jgi:hypothetical protein
MIMDFSMRVLDGLNDAAQVLLVGKSLGSLAMPLAAERGLPGVWLTPLLGEPWIADTARRLGPDHLLAGGRSDPVWDAEVAAASRARVLEVSDADHALQVDGDLAATMAAISALARTVDDFLADLPA